MYLSLQEQRDTQASCKPYLTAPTLQLQEKKHIQFLSRGLQPLSEGYISLDAARPWLFYWCLAGLALLPDTEHIIQNQAVRLRHTLRECQHPDGGFGGGYGQMAHLAPTYAAVLSLAVVGDVEGFKLIDRPRLYSWLLSLKQGDGGFAIQRNGEVDARAAYLALSVAALLDLLTPELTDKSVDWLSQCQRYEGGMAGVGVAEAHGGLSFCAMAALCILGDSLETFKRALDIPMLLKWLAYRQETVEGGYNGRTNKLVDGCYSWWVGAEFGMIEAALGMTISLYDREAVKKYILQCCQIPSRGGLRDKPDKQPDYYHTCYCLAGLSTAIYRYEYDPSRKPDQKLGSHSFSWQAHKIGDNTDDHCKVGKMHPIYALPWGCAEKMRAWSVKQGSV